MNRQTPVKTVPSLVLRTRAVIIRHSKPSFVVDTKHRSGWGASDCNLLDWSTYFSSDMMLFCFTFLIVYWFLVSVPSFVYWKNYDLKISIVCCWLFKSQLSDWHRGTTAFRVPNIFIVKQLLQSLKKNSQRLYMDLCCTLYTTGVSRFWIISIVVPTRGTSISWFKSEKETRKTSAAIDVTFDLLPQCSTEIH